jgi:RNA exonuclease 4
MPHVKGNKFKPKAPVDIPAEILGFDDGEVVQSAKRKSSLTLNLDGEDSGAAAAAQPKSKKARPAKPVIPTVLAPAPKGTSVANKAASTSNWESLKAAMQAKSSKGNKNKKRKGAPDTSKPANTATAHLTKLLALDCEMVGVGKRGDRSILARVSVVNSDGAVVYDSFVAPTEKVTDYRTKWSGVRHSNLKDTPSFEQVKLKVKELLRGRVLVGHAVHNDLEVLGIDHPESDLRDTSRYPPLMKVLTNGRIKPRALRHLAQEHLTLAIQAAEHCSIEDARASLGLYQKHKKEWEKWLSGGGIVPKATVKAVSMPDMGGMGVAANRKAGAGPLGAERLAELALADYMADL